MKIRSRRFVTPVLVAGAIVPWILFFLLPVFSLLRAGRMMGQDLGPGALLSGMLDPLLLAKVALFLI